MQRIDFMRLGRAYPRMNWEVVEWEDLRLKCEIWLVFMLRSAKRFLFEYFLPFWVTLLIWRCKFGSKMTFFFWSAGWLPIRISSCNYSSAIESSLSELLTTTSIMPRPKESYDVSILTYCWLLSNCLFCLASSFIICIEVWWLFLNDDAKDFYFYYFYLLYLWLLWVLLAIESNEVASAISSFYYVIYVAFILRMLFSL